MDIRPIHNEQDHKQALRKISVLIDADPEPSTPDGDLLEILTALVENYEAKHFPLAPHSLSEPSGAIVAEYERIRDAYGRAYELLKAKRDQAVKTPELHEENGVIKAYEVTLDALAQAHNAINALGWAVGEHDVDFDQTLEGAFSSPEALFKAVGI